MFTSYVREPVCVIVAHLDFFYIYDLFLSLTWFCISFSLNISLHPELLCSVEGIIFSNTVRI